MDKHETAVLAGGCFWCTEAIFQRLKGVISVVSGYTGGTVPDPTYEQVCTGKTGHAEAIQITFDPNVIAYTTLLDIFWHLHNPTTLNQQGADHGTQYRSAIFYTNENQRIVAEKSKTDLEKSGMYKDKIVTEIVPLKTFYQAEGYHQEYYNKNKMLNPYCTVVIDPKIKKLLSEYSSLVNP